MYTYVSGALIANVTKQQHCLSNDVYKRGSLCDVMNKRVKGGGKQQSLWTNCSRIVAVKQNGIQTRSERSEASTYSEGTTDEVRTMTFTVLLPL